MIYKHTRTAIYIRDNYSCVYCGLTDKSTKNLTLDHVKARKNGGSNSYKNLVTCCRHCNSTKKDLSLNYWLILLQQRFINTERIQVIKKKLENNSRMLPCEMRALRNKAKGIQSWCKLTKGHTLLQQRGQ